MTCKLERRLFLQVGLKTFWRNFCTEGRKRKGETVTVVVTVQSVDVAFILIWENALAIDLGETSRVILQSNVHGWISLCTNMAPHARALSRQTEQVDPLETVIDFQTQFYSHSGKFRSITGTLPCCSNGYGFELYSPTLMAHSCNFSEAPCGVTLTGKQTQTSESKDSELRLDPPRLRREETLTEF